MTFSIGGFYIKNGLALSPMAGITDKPFRKICRNMGADWVVGEMISGDPTLRHTQKTLQRIDFQNEPKPIVVQIVGNSPAKMAEAAQYYQSIGADVIDINMGCPAKKVCQSYAGSALLKDETLVESILTAVVSAVSIPVTLKTRLGWDDEHLNVLAVAKMAESSGISALAVHGRSRTQMYRGRAKFELIKTLKKEFANLPLWANGDIDSLEKALKIFDYTKANGVMIGRGALGRPWLFYEIKAYLEKGQKMILPFGLISRTIKEHIKDIYHFYGEVQGCKFARKHIGWYLENLIDNKSFKTRLFSLDNSQQQYEALSLLLEQPIVEDYYYQYYSNDFKIGV